MNFSIGVASRIDDIHIQMKDLEIQTFDDVGQPEMSIMMPKDSIFDTDTGVITSQQHVTIHRADFELTGEAVIFNTLTKQGGLGGNVHMLIYDLEGETSADVETSATPKPQDPSRAPDVPRADAAKVPNASVSRVPDLPKSAERKEK
jgi:hypothetical protein